MLLDDLNAEQREAVLATEGYVRVNAGAGTGKTRTLTYRCAFLLTALGISPRSVLCVTFTNKAAGELKQRLGRLCGEISNPFVTTFHGFCAEFLRQEAVAAGWPQNFSILDVDDSIALIRRVFRALKVNGRDFPLKKAWEYIDGRKYDISYAKDFIAADSQILLRRAETAPCLEEKVFFNYLFLERQQYSLDFDDLIALTLIILEQFPEVRARWQERLEYILVDEFQDIDKLQYQLVETLAGRHHNLFIVGDPDQTIYSFRGADVTYFTNFTKVHPDAQSFNLRHNYRSQPPILDCAYTVISHNSDVGRKKLFSRQTMTDQDAVPVNLTALRPKKGDDPLADLRRAAFGKPRQPAAEPQFTAVLPPPRSLKPALIHFKDRKQEARFIADEIKDILKSRPQDNIAVLYRSRFISAPIEKALVQAQIPYRVYSDVPFFQRAEIKDAVSYLKLVLNPSDDVAFVRVINRPRRGFGQKRLESLVQLAQRDKISLFAALCKYAREPELHVTAPVLLFISTLGQLHQAPRVGPLSELERILNAFAYEDYLKQTGDEDRMQNLNMLREQCRSFEQEAGERTVLADFLQHIALFTSNEDAGSAPQVVLMTIHNAKGLEFDNVFIAALNEKIFPSAKVQNLPQLEEERRLLYVALTRAKKQVFMTESSQRPEQEQQDLQASRFIGELKDEEILECGGRRRQESRGGSPASMPPQRFAEGDIVFNQVIGKGRIDSVMPETGEYKIYFFELGRSRTMSFAAPLKLVQKAGAEMEQGAQEQAEPDAEAQSKRETEQEKSGISFIIDAKQ